MKPDRKEFFVMGRSWLGLRVKLLRVRTSLDVQAWGNRIARALGGKYLVEV